MRRVPLRFHRACVAAGFLVLSLVLGAQGPARSVQSPAKGARLTDLRWPDAEQRLRPDTVVVLPLGAAAQEHGPHLPLRTDADIANYLAHRLVQIADVIAAPPLTYHHFTAFEEYPGSTSVSPETARGLIVDVVRSISRHGPRRFYVLDVGHTYAEGIAGAAAVLAREGTLLTRTNWSGRLEALRRYQQQPAGSHADEAETSLMLHIDPSAVMVPLARRDLRPVSTPFRLTRQEGGRGTYSPSGVWGDPTLATAAKGRVLADALVSAIAADLEELRRAASPSGSAPAAAIPRPSTPQPPRSRADGECEPGDDRRMRAIAPGFEIAWSNKDPLAVAALWSDDGDMAHPDGFVERTAQVIRENRTQLFMRREYRLSRHFLSLGTIRCITGDVAVADGKWELRGMADAAGEPLPPVEGLCTLVLRRRGAEWKIAAWRYTITPAAQPASPRLLTRPGFLGPVRR